MITAGRRGSLAKAVSLILALSLLGLPGSLAARERHGVQVDAR